MEIENGRNGRNRKILAAFAVMAILLISPFIRADIVTINIQAVVDSVYDPGNQYLEGKIQQGSIITGYYIFDSAAADEYPMDPTWGGYHYSNSPYGIFLSTNGFVFQTNPSATNLDIEIVNDHPVLPFPFDGYRVTSSNNLPFSHNSPGYGIWWVLTYPTYVLSSDELTVTVPSLENLLGNYLRIRLNSSYVDHYLIDAHVTSAIPEPSSLFLISLGIFGIFFRKDKKR